MGRSVCVACVLGGGGGVLTTFILVLNVFQRGIYGPPREAIVSNWTRRSHKFVEIDHEIISKVILLLPLIQEGLMHVSYKREYVHDVLFNRLVKLAQEKVWLGEPTVST